jgi:hypothetical protein
MVTIRKDDGTTVYVWACRKWNSRGRHGENAERRPQRTVRTLPKHVRLGDVRAAWNLRADTGKRSRDRFYLDSPDVAPAPKPPSTTLLERYTAMRKITVRYLVAIPAPGISLVRRELPYRRPIRPPMACPFVQ